MTEQNTSIELESVIEVTQAVCECLLGDFAEPRPPSPSHAPPSEGELVAWVSITGAWSGDVKIRLSPELARRLAREILQIDPDSTDDAGVRDVAGEVANMIGGNLKALLPEPCRLSLPKVTKEAPVVEGELTQAFSLGADTFEVSVKAAA
jgi:chemotaxis protein CheX